MIEHIFNRTIFLWAAAIVIALFIVSPRAALLQRINTMHGNYIDCVREQGCSDTKAIAEAREYYLILAQLYPQYGRGSEMQGICYLLLKQDNLAIKKFQEAIKYNPDLFWVSFELGKAFYRRGEYSQALKCFQGIMTQDSISLLKKATLSPLTQFSDKTREGLILSLVDFVTEIKLRSYQMAVGCRVHQGDLTQAKNMVSQELNNQQLGGNDFSVMANSSLDKDGPRKEMLSWIDGLAYSKPINHPWGHLIQPGREILYR